MCPINILHRKNSNNYCSIFSVKSRKVRIHYSPSNLERRLRRPHSSAVHCPQGNDLVMHMVTDLTHTRTHTHTHSHTQTHTRALTHTRMHSDCTHKHIYIHLNTYTPHQYTNTHINTYIHKHTHTSIRKPTFTNMYRARHTHVDTKAHMQCAARVRDLKANIGNRFNC